MWEYTMQSISCQVIYEIVGPVRHSKERPSHLLRRFYTQFRLAGDAGAVILNAHIQLADCVIV